MKLFDLHCDTVPKIYKGEGTLLSNNLGVSIENFEKYQKKAQVFAIWCNSESTDDESFLEFMHMADFFNDYVNENEDKITLCTQREHLEDTEKENLKAILAVEDARLLGGNLERLEKLYEKGVRVLTLGWSGTTCIGGSHDTDEGLTQFGIEVVKKCEDMGIIIDVSHLSDKSFWDVAGIATKPFIASHSNSSMLYNHPRNLTDTQLRTIISAGGIVGVSFVGKHLSALLTNSVANENKVYETICSHIEHFLEIDERSVCIGSDFDGTEHLWGLENVAQTENLYKALVNRISSEQTADNVFYNNAYNFFVNNI